MSWFPAFANADGEGPWLACCPPPAMLLMVVGGLLATDTPSFSRAFAKAAKPEVSPARVSLVLFVFDAIVSKCLSPFGAASSVGLALGAVSRAGAICAEGVSFEACMFAFIVCNSSCAF